MTHTRSTSSPVVLSDHHILIVDDDPGITKILERLLRVSGFTHIRTTNDSRTALPLFRASQPDIVLLDVHMPHLDGLHLMKLLKAQIPAEEYLPFLVITGDGQPELRRRILAHGAQDFLTKPFDADEVELRVRNLLRTRAMHLELERQVRGRTSELKQAEIEIANRLAAAAELRDYAGGDHPHRVGRLSALLADTIGMPREQVEGIRQAAPLHDIGKLSIPDAILLKPGPLTDDEFEVIKQHTTIGARALTGSVSPILRVAEEIALYHHENWDGTGYTPGLAGEAIPVTGRIVAVADTFDALVNERPYKDAWPRQKALEFIISQRGAKFDPALVDAFVQIHDRGLLHAVAEPEDEPPLFSLPLGHDQLREPEPREHPPLSLHSRPA